MAQRIKTATVLVALTVAYRTRYTTEQTIGEVVQQAIRTVLVDEPEELTQNNEPFRVERAELVRDVQRYADAHKTNHAL